MPVPQEEVEKQQAQLASLMRLHAAAEEYWALVSQDGTKGPPMGRAYLPDGGMVQVLPPDHDALDLDLGEGYVQSLEWHAWKIMTERGFWPVPGEGYYTLKVQVSNLCLPIEMSVPRSVAAKMADFLRANMKPRFRFVGHLLLDTLR
jgi:hypothetical protein